MKVDPLLRCTTPEYRPSCRGIGTLKDLISFCCNHLHWHVGPLSSRNHTPSRFKKMQKATTLNFHGSSQKWLSTLHHLVICTSYPSMYDLCLMETASAFINLAASVDFQVGIKTRDILLQCPVCVKYSLIWNNYEDEYIFNNQNIATNIWSMSSIAI